METKSLYSGNGAKPLGKTILLVDLFNGQMVSLVSAPEALEEFMEDTYGGLGSVEKVLGYEKWRIEWQSFGGFPIKGEAREIEARIFG